MVKESRIDSKWIKYAFMKVIEAIDLYQCQSHPQLAEKYYCGPALECVASGLMIIICATVVT